MENPEWLDGVVVTLFVLTVLVVFGTLFYLKAWRPRRGWERANGELQDFDELGLEHRPTDDPRHIGRLEGTYRGYRIEVTPDEPLRILVTLETDPRIVCDIGSGMRIENASEFRRAPKLLEAAFATREREHGLAPDPDVVDALRAFLDEWKAELSYFHLFEHRLGVSPREGTSRHVRWITAEQIRTLVPALVDLASVLDGRAAEPPRTGAPASFEDFLRPIAEELGGTIGPQGFGVACVGQIEARPFELSIATASGAVAAELGLLGPVRGLQIYYDPDEDHGDMVAIGEHLYLGPDDDEEGAARAAFEALPPGTRDVIAQFMRDCAVFRFGVDPERLEVELLEVAPRLESGPIAACVRRLCELAAMLEANA